MQSITTSARRVWKSAQLYIGFHRDPKGKKRDTPHVWSPKNARAALPNDADEQEVFVVVKAADGDAAQDVQIKLHPDMIVLRRDCPDTWQGVVIEQYELAVKLGDVSIRINFDGTITRKDANGTTWVEADGGILKKTEFVDAAMSAEGTELSRRTPDNFAAITLQGVVSKAR